MNPTYTPLPGTIPDKVLKHLNTLPAGAEIATAELNDAIGQRADYTISTCLQAALKAGLLKSRRQQGAKYLLWSLGNGEPIPGPVDDESDDDASEAAPPPAKPAFPTVRASSAQQTSAALRPITDDRFWVTVDLQGSLTIRSSDTELALSHAQTQLIVRMAAANGITA